MADRWGESEDPRVALLILTFLQADCKDQVLYWEVQDLVEEVNRTRDSIWNWTGIGIGSEDDGDLEADGHQESCISAQIQDLRPEVDLRWPRDPVALQQVADELRQIASQFESHLVDQASRNLRGRLHSSPPEQWSSLLNLEVAQVLRQAAGLDHFPQERVLVALTLTLVKGVCEQAPLFLRDLVTMAMEYITPSRTRTTWF